MVGRTLTSVLRVMPECQFASGAPLKIARTIMMMTRETVASQQRNSNPHELVMALVDSDDHDAGSDLELVSTGM